MRHTVRKVFFAWDFEREEAWLNEMSAKGMQLVAVGLGTYVFEEGKPGDYTYRLELLENWPGHSRSRDYIGFLEDSGVEHVASFARWVYLRKKATDGPFDIYSDLNSRLKHYKSVMTLCFVVVPLSISPVMHSIDDFAATGSIGSFFFSSISVLFMGALGLGIFKMVNKVRTLEREKAIRE